MGHSAALDAGAGAPGSAAGDVVLTVYSDSDLTFVNTLSPISPIFESVDISVGGGVDDTQTTLIRGADVSITAVATDSKLTSQIESEAGSAWAGLLVGYVERAIDTTLSRITGLNGQLNIRGAGADIDLARVDVQATGGVTVEATTQATASLTTFSLNGVAGSGTFQSITVAIGVGIATATSTADLTTPRSWPAATCRSRPARPPTPS